MIAGVSAKTGISKMQTTSQVFRFVMIEIEGCYRMEMNVEKTKLMRISRQPFPVKIIIDQKQLENVEPFKYLGSILTNDGRCTCEIKCRTTMAKVAFNKKHIGLGIGEDACEVLHLEHSFIWC